MRCRRQHHDQGIHKHAGLLHQGRGQLPGHLQGFQLVRKRLAVNSECQRGLPLQFTGRMHRQRVQRQQRANLHDDTDRVRHRGVRFHSPDQSLPKGREHNQGQLQLRKHGDGASNKLHEDRGVPELSDFELLQCREMEGWQCGPVKRACQQSRGR
ncbi:hypothetical protein E2P64_00220 [Candidatus Bathyarchaeota archaeon]|nr:hypothetical protein E2P64_00220 [Candidatus Bathyarchaeota archaeon]